jgi:hypothetical protein
MKIYITSRFAGDQNRDEIEQLCAAVRSAGLVDFSFVRDVERYQKIFPDPQELWRRTKEELSRCDALLIDVSDNPYALGLPIFVLAKNGVAYKPVYDGIATEIIRYRTYGDSIPTLQKYAAPR